MFFRPRASLGFKSNTVLASIVRLPWLVKLLIYWRDLNFFRPWLGGFLKCVILLCAGSVIELVIIWFWYVVPHWDCVEMKNRTEIHRARLFDGHVFENIKCFTENCLLFKINLEYVSHNKPRHPWSWHNFKKMNTIRDLYGARLPSFLVTFQPKWKKFCLWFLKLFTQNGWLL